MNDKPSKLDQNRPRTNSSICKDCLKIDLSPAFAIPVPSIEELEEWRIGSGLFITELRHFSSGCELCREFRSVNRLSDPCSLHHLRAYPFSPVFYSALQRGHYKGRNSTIAFPKGLIWLHPFSEIDIEIHLVAIAEVASKDGWIACNVTVNGPELFRPQMVPERFDDRPVKAWLNVCKTKHSSCRPSSDIRNLTLINCETLELCQPNNQPPYVALSYVWGKISACGIESSAGADGVFLSQLPPQQALPQVIQDSIHVSRRLGFQYLWIDKYCINQIDKVQRESQISEMDMIYRGADLTIIALAGRDEGYGLPGVGVARHIPLAHQFNTFNIMHMTPDFRSKWHATTWSGRAWTFQEELFSRRRLYFFSEGVSFLCQEMFCDEAYGGAELSNHMGNGRTYSAVWFATSQLRDLFVEDPGASGFSAEPTSRGFAFPTEEKENGAKEVRELIENYSRRKMTYQSDAERAFSGIRRYFEAREPSIYMIQGLPAMLSTSPDTGHFLGEFLSSLCWTFQDFRLPSRRSGFASWTWLGWFGQVYFPEKWNRTAFEVDEQSISFKYVSGKEIALAELATILSSKRKGINKHNDSQTLPGSNSNVDLDDLLSPIGLRLRCPVIMATQLSFDSPDDWQNVVIAGMKHSSAYRQFPFTPLFLKQGIATGNLGCVLLRIKLRAYWLLIEWRGQDDATRVGMLETCWFDSEGHSYVNDINVENLLDTLAWREIRLI